MRQCLTRISHHPLAGWPPVAAALNVPPLEAKTRPAHGRPLLACEQRCHDCGGPSVPSVSHIAKARQLPKGCCGGESTRRTRSTPAIQEFQNGVVSLYRRLYLQVSFHNRQTIGFALRAGISMIVALRRTARLMRTLFVLASGICREKLVLAPTQFV